MRIVCPDRNNAVAFINRKQLYSVNFQAACDSKVLITNIFAPWPGSTHDPPNFDNCTIAEQFHNGSISGLLVGDSRYACRYYLMTPLLNPRNEAEVHYNDAQRWTRIVIERCFGILKRCFPCLHVGLHTCLGNSLVIIVAIRCSSSPSAISWLCCSTQGSLFPFLCKPGCSWSTCPL